MRISLIIEVIPALLYISGFLFLEGLVMSVFTIHHTIAYVVLAATAGHGNASHMPRQSINLWAICPHVSSALLLAPGSLRVLAANAPQAGSLRPLPHQGNPDAQGSTTDAPVPIHKEGEWRKRQMLDIANSLDARYRTLLDTMPLRAPDLPAPTPPPTTAASPAPAPAPASPISAAPLGHMPNHIPNTTPIASASQT
jgi:hypothetical protein